MQIERAIAPRTAGLLAIAATALVALPAAAQGAPSDVRDLVGARAAGGESELQARGYVSTGGQRGDDRKWTYWWNGSRSVCLSVSTMQGRFDAITATPAADCGQGDYRPPRMSYGDASGGDYSEHIALVCYGEGHRMTSQLKSGYEWDRDKKRYVPSSGVELTNEDFDTSVMIEIDGDEGRIKPAKSMLPILHSDSDGGWYRISNLRISRDFIRGEFKLNGANRPKITIDRRAGRISLDGLTSFNGTCDPLDGDRKF